MGVDITMHLIKGNEIVMRDLFIGRNSEWFAKLQNRYDDRVVYEYLPRHYNFEDNDVFMEENPEEDYYGHAYIKWFELTKWISKYKPQLDAGWVHSYDAWAYANKNIVPDVVWKYLPEEANMEDIEFIQYLDEYEPMYEIYTKIVDYLTTIEEDDYSDYRIAWCFDC